MRSGDVLLAISLCGTRRVEVPEACILETVGRTAPNAKSRSENRTEPGKELRARRGELPAVEPALPDPAGERAPAARTSAGDCSSAAATGARGIARAKARPDRYTGAARPRVRTVLTPAAAKCRSESHRQDNELDSEHPSFAGRRQRHGGQPCDGLQAQRRACGS